MEGSVECIIALCEALGKWRPQCLKLVLLAEYISLLFHPYTAAGTNAVLHHRISLLFPTILNYVPRPSHSSDLYLRFPPLKNADYPLPLLAPLL